MFLCRNMANYHEINPVIPLLILSTAQCMLLAADEAGTAAEIVFTVLIKDALLPYLLGCKTDFFPSKTIPKI